MYLWPHRELGLRLWNREPARNWKTSIFFCSTCPRWGGGGLRVGADPPPCLPTAAVINDEHPDWGPPAPATQSVPLWTRAQGNAPSPPPPFVGNVQRAFPPPPPPPRDVLERPDTVGGGGVTPPTAKILLQRLRCQADLRFKIFGPPSAGAIGGPWEEGGSQPNPTLSPPSDPQQCSQRNKEFKSASPPSGAPPGPLVHSQSSSKACALSGCGCDPAAVGRGPVSHGVRLPKSPTFALLTFVRPRPPCLIGTDEPSFRCALWC